MAKLTLPQRTYLLLSAVLILPLLLYAYADAQRVKAMLLEEKRLELKPAAAALIYRLPATFPDYLAAQKLANAPDEEKRQALNRVLQPIVDQVASENPAYIGLGYYSKDLKILAYAPRRQKSQLGRKAPPEVLSPLYATGEPLFTFVEQSVVNEGGRVLSLSLPLYASDQLIGHVWACLLYTSPSPRD